MNTTPAHRRHLQAMTKPGHAVTIVRGVGRTMQATCACGWAGTDMRGDGAHQAAVDQYRSHLLGLEA